MTLLDTGRLAASDGTRFITSGIGPEFAQLDAPEFNILPPSGGRVYVFEKEDGNWNAIQEIKSPNDTAYGGGYYYNLPDMLGHAVAIS